GQVAGISARFWLPEIKTDFTVAVAWDWDRNSLGVSISRGFGTPGKAGRGDETITLINEPLSQFTAPRVILSRLLARLNERLPGTGSTLGDQRPRAREALRLDG